MAHKRGDYSALGKVRVGLAALYIYGNVFYDRASYRTSNNGSAVGVAVCVYGEILYNRAFADETYQTFRHNGTRYGMTRSVERSAETVKPVYVLPVFVVAVIEVRFGIADIGLQFIISVNRVLCVVGFQKIVQLTYFAYLRGYNRYGDMHGVKLAVFTYKRGNRTVSVNNLIRLKFIAYRERGDVVAEIVIVAEYRIYGRPVVFAYIYRRFASVKEYFLRSAQSHFFGIAEHDCSDIRSDKNAVYGSERYVYDVFTEIFAEYFTLVEKTENAVFKPVFGYYMPVTFDFLDFRVQETLADFQYDPRFLNVDYIGDGYLDYAADFTVEPVGFFEIDGNVISVRIISREFLYMFRVYYARNEFVSAERVFFAAAEKRIEFDVLRAHR